MDNARNVAFRGFYPGVAIWHTSKAVVNLKVKVRIQGKTKFKFTPFSKFDCLRATPWLLK